MERDLSQYVAFHRDGFDGSLNVSALGVLIDTGTDEQIRESARYALKHGMPGGGYIFSTSNCIYTGMPLEGYETMLNVWRKEGNY